VSPHDQATINIHWHGWFIRVVSIHPRRKVIMSSSRSVVWCQSHVPINTREHVATSHSESRFGRTTWSGTRTSRNEYQKPRFAISSLEEHVVPLGCVLRSVTFQRRANELYLPTLFRRLDCPAVPVCTRKLSIKRSSRASLPPSSTQLFCQRGATTDSSAYGGLLRTINLAAANLRSVARKCYTPANPDQELACTEGKGWSF